MFTPSASNPDRYSDYARRIHEVDLPVLWRRPFREVPITEDPRRAESFNHYLEVQRAQRDGTPTEEVRELLRRGQHPGVDAATGRLVLVKIKIPESRSKMPSDPGHIPNVRDPRRIKAFIRAGHEIIDLSPVTLVDLPEPDEENAVLVIDHSNWPESVATEIQQWPHECNVLRAQNVEFENLSIDDLVEVLEEVEPTAPSAVLSDSIEIIEEEEEEEEEQKEEKERNSAHLYDIDTFGDKPMQGLELDDHDTKVDTITPAKLKRKNSKEHSPAQKRLKPRTDAHNVDIIDLEDEISQNKCPEIISIDSDDDENNMCQNIGIFDPINSQSVNKCAAVERTSSIVFSPPKCSDAIPFLEGNNNSNNNIPDKKDPRGTSRPRKISNNNNNLWCGEKEATDDENEILNIDKYEETQPVADRGSSTMKKELNNQSQPKQLDTCRSNNELLTNRSNDLQKECEQRRPMQIYKDNDGCELINNFAIEDECVIECSEPDAYESMSDGSDFYSDSDGEYYDLKLVERVKARVKVREENKENFVQVPKHHSKKNSFVALSDKQCTKESSNQSLNMQEKPPLAQSLNSEKCLSTVAPGETCAMKNFRVPSTSIITLNMPNLINSSCQNFDVHFQKASLSVTSLQSRNYCADKQNFLAQSSCSVGNLYSDTRKLSMECTFSRQVERLQPQSFLATLSSSLNDKRNLESSHTQRHSYLNSNLKTNSINLEKKEKQLVSCHEVTFSTTKSKIQMPNGTIFLHPQISALIDRMKCTLPHRTPNRVVFPRQQFSSDNVHELSNFLSMVANWQIFLGMNQNISLLKFLTIERNVRREIHQKRYGDKQQEEDMANLVKDKPKMSEGIIIHYNPNEEPKNNKNSLGIKTPRHTFKANQVKRRHSLSTIIESQPKRRRYYSLECTSSISLYARNRSSDESNYQIRTSERNFDTNQSSDKSNCQIQSSEQNFDTSKSTTDVPQLEINEFRPIETSIETMKRNMFKGLSPSLKNRVKRKNLQSGDDIQKYVDTDAKQRKIEKNQEIDKFASLFVNKPSVKILSVENIDGNKLFSNHKSESTISNQKKFPPKVDASIFNFNQLNDNFRLKSHPKIIDDKSMSALPSPPLEHSDLNLFNSCSQLILLPLKIDDCKKKDNCSLSVNQNDKIISMPSFPIESDLESNDSGHSIELTIMQTEQISNNENSNEKISNNSNVDINLNSVNGITPLLKLDKDCHSNILEDDVSKLSSETSIVEEEKLSSNTNNIDHNCNIKEDSEKSKESLCHNEEHVNAIEEILNCTPFSDSQDVKDSTEFSEVNKNSSDSTLLILDSTLEKPNPDSTSGLTPDRKFKEPNSDSKLEASYIDSTLEGYTEGDLFYAQFQQEKLNDEDDYDVIYDEDDVTIYKSETVTKSADKFDNDLKELAIPYNNRDVDETGINSNIDSLQKELHSSKSDDDIAIIFVTEKQPSKQQPKAKKIIESNRSEKVSETNNSNSKEISNNDCKSQDSVYSNNSEINKETFSIQDPRAKKHEANNRVQDNNILCDIEDMIISSCENLDKHISNEPAAVDATVLSKETKNDKINNVSSSSSVILQNNISINEMPDTPLSIPLNVSVHSQNLDNENRFGRSRKSSVEISFKNKELLAELNIMLVSSKSDEPSSPFAPFTDQESKTVNDLLSSLVQNHINFTEPIINNIISSVDNIKLLNQLCKDSQLNLNDNLLEELNMHFVDVDNVHLNNFKQNKNLSSEAKGKKSPAYLKVKSKKNLFLSGISTPLVSTSLVLPQNSGNNAILVQEPLQPISNTVHTLNIPAELSQPSSQLGSNFQSPIYLTIPSVLVSIPDNESNSSNNTIMGVGKPVKIFASSLFNLEHSHKSELSISPKLSTSLKKSIFHFSLPPKERIYQVDIPETFKVCKDDSLESISLKITNYKKSLLNKMKDCLCSIDTDNFKNNLNKLLEYKILTEATWNNQLNILRIIQCITAIENVCVPLDISDILEGILNSEQISSLSKFVDKTTLPNLIKSYTKLENQGIISLNAKQGCPLFEEIENTGTELEQSKFKLSKFQKKKLKEQVNQYLLIVKETEKQLSTLDYQNLRLRKRELKYLKSSWTGSITNHGKTERLYPESADSLFKSNFLEENSLSSKCLNCRKPTEIVCNNCRKATYCSKKCQNSHWKQEHHKKCK